MFFDIVATSGRQYWRAANIKKQKRHNYQTVRCEFETRPEHREDQPSVRGTAAPPSPVHLVRMLSFNSLLFCASLHVHSGVFRFSQSVVFLNLIWVSVVFFFLFFLFFFFVGRREVHWLSSRAQTCCGHPVRPFTFFSAPKDSCRPSVCDTRNTKSSSAGGQINTGSLALVCSGLSLDITTFPATFYYRFTLRVILLKIAGLTNNSYF